MRYLRRIYLILALLGGCLPHPEARATNAAIGGLLAYDLDQCIEKSGGWSAYDACEARIRTCAQQAKTVGDYDSCVGVR